MKILLVETDTKLNQEFVHILTQQNFDLSVAIDPETAKERLHQTHFDLVVLCGERLCPAGLELVEQVHRSADPAIVLLLLPSPSPTVKLIQPANPANGKWSEPERRQFANPQELLDCVESSRLTLAASSATVPLAEGSASYYPTVPPSSAPAPLQMAMQQIWTQSRFMSYERIKSLAATQRQLKQGATQVIQPMLQTAHKLVGSLGTFGFQDASQIACSIEKLLISYSEIPATDTAECLSQIDGLIEDLQAELVDRDEQLGLPAIGTTADPAPAAPAFAGLAPANLASVAQPILLVIDGDRELTDSLLQEAIAWKMRVVVAATIEQGRAQIQQERPAAVLLDPTLPGIPEALLAELAAADDPIPVLIFSLKDRSIERVNALRLGGQLFLPKSATPGQIFRAVTEVLQPPEPLHAKVLAVDDDPQILLSLRALLEPEGIQLTCLSDSTQFWETLRSVQPDLVIFDLRMPQISGLDLCQSVRHDFQWNWLPVIFLTTSSDRETIQQVFRAGADDYVTKPIVPEELLLRVLNRLKRSRLLRDRAEIDELTGVANRQHSTKTLTQLIQFATDFQQPFCLAILDLDHFKQINDRYGHAQGDRILHQFGQFLQQKFRSGDLVARWGGEEFVVGMYGISSEDSIDRLANMLEEWQAQTITSLTGELLKVSFSAGLAQFPADGTALQVLYRAADAALYRAKRGGRSRIVASHWQSTRSPATPGKVAEVPIRASVAVVHPNLEFAQSLRRSFEIRGYSMQWLQSGEAAIEHLQNPTFSLPGVPTLMLLAEQTTDWDGLTVLRQLKAEVKNRMQIILLLDQSALLEEAQALSVADVLLMPCSVTVILQRLRQLIR